MGIGHLVGALLPIAPHHAQDNADGHADHDDASCDAEDPDQPGRGELRALIAAHALVILAAFIAAVSVYLAR